MNIVLSTRNPSKIEQIREIFSDSLIVIQTLQDLGVVGEAVEDGETLSENAFKKAAFAKERSPDGVWTMAEDTGLFINVLGGLPGVRSARWAGKNATTEDILYYCLMQMLGHTDRRAKFETVVVLVSPEGEKHFFTGTLEGTLLKSARGVPQNKMPYSSLFLPNGCDKVWAEMTVAEENAISHRGKAFRQALDFLKDF